MAQILLVIDMQNDFIDGALGTAEALAIVPNVIHAIQSFPGDVWYTKDTHFEDYAATQEGKRLPVPHCLKGQNGWELWPSIARLQRAANSPVVEKNTFGAQNLPALLQRQYPQGLEVIQLVGLCTDICVISNALLLKAFFPETTIQVLADCCAGVTPRGHQNALEAMAVCQIEIMGA